MASNRFSRLIKIFTGTHTGGESELLQLEGRLERFVHFWVLVVKSFIHIRGFARANALAYTSLLALIPLLAVAVSITSSLMKSQGENQIYHAIDQFVSTMMPPATLTPTNIEIAPESGPRLSLALNPGDGTNGIGATNYLLRATVANSITNSAPEETERITAQKVAARNIHDYIQNAQSGRFGITGMLVFVVIAILMLNSIEGTFNDIWGVTRGRNWWHQICTYFTLIALGPVLLATAMRLAGRHYLHATGYLAEKMPSLGEWLLPLLPIVILWLAFTLFYLLVPNTRVRPAAAVVGGLVASGLWHLNSSLGFLYVSRVVTNNKIYGSIGLIPVFMLGLYFSWVILLFGAQVAYAFQNRNAYLQDKIADHVNQRGREFVALRIMTLLGRRFQNGDAPATVFQLSTELDVPSRLVEQILRVLAAAHLVVEVGGAAGAYVPARPLENINAHHILHALRAGSGHELPFDNAPAPAAIYGEFARIEAAERVAAEKISLLALARRLPAPLTLEPPQAGTKTIAAAPLPDQSDEPARVETPEPPEPPAAELEIVEKPPAGEALSEKSSPEIDSTVIPEKEPSRRETAKPTEQEFPL